MSKFSEVKVKIQKESGKLSGLYSITVHFPTDRPEVPEPFTPSEMKKLQEFAEMEGFTGHLPLHDWIKNNKNIFFRENIGEGDSERVVIAILEELKDRWLNVIF